MPPMECLCSAAAAIADASKHALVKDAWEFLHDEGHINQGVLEGEPPRRTACESYLQCLRTCYIVWQSQKMHATQRANSHLWQ